MGNSISEFSEYRERMNARLLEGDHLLIKRIFNIDARAYEDGALSSSVKEMLGLVSSMVLRCDDCIRYHLVKCYEAGLTRDQLFEIFGIANLVGGTIVIPHTRRALEFWDALDQEKNG